MASLCRSASTAARCTVGGASRSVASVRSVSQLCSTPSPRVFSSSLLRRSLVSCSAMGSVIELSLMPRHSAEASARLKSFIAVNSSSWSWLTQGRALPL
ncbi:hypothetical protein FCM35_KLT11352 [Carex littledalei]|uniref:Protein NUCLEAR FUSION DEFECTIVE 6, chloroplastic/mitochondrial n=1 Tax=Carex littledalei TaxID=544730 RepID=A0A833QGE4_9POAL|nr:hypothetical protein FCM35_KLT11352 [Carex littledalei]